MPELPEVHTTVEGLKKVIIGKTIKDVWSDFHIGTAHGERKTIKNKKYFEKFKRTVTGAKIKGVERRGKNILINLNSEHTVVVHMKMTGHLMVGKYERVTRYEVRGTKKETWVAIKKGPLQDPYNQFVHLVFSLSGGTHLVLSDMRKFASVTVCKTEEMKKHETVGKLGPEPLQKDFSAEKFFEAMRKKKGCPVKSALMDQSVLAGIGNIYSDEMLWHVGVHPLSPADKVGKGKYEEMFKAMQKVLRLSIKHGGDSKSDYRNAFGEKGGFQKFHKAYGRKGRRCPKKDCSGIIERIVVRGRSAHFCPKHQIIYG